MILESVTLLYVFVGFYIAFQVARKWIEEFGHPTDVADYGCLGFIVLGVISVWPGVLLIYGTGWAVAVLLNRFR